LYLSILMTSSQSSKACVSSTLSNTTLAPYLPAISSTWGSIASARFDPSNGTKIVLYMISPFTIWLFNRNPLPLPYLLARNMPSFFDLHIYRKFIMLTTVISTNHFLHIQFLEKFQQIFSNISKCLWFSINTPAF